MERRGEPEFTVIAEHVEDGVRVIDAVRLRAVVGLPIVADANVPLDEVQIRGEDGPSSFRIKL